MTQPAKSQEPSMEEILASIRRIIADEDANKSSSVPEPAKAAVRPPAPVLRVQPEARLPELHPAESAPAPAPSAPPPAPPADILDLTESMAAPSFGQPDPPPKPAPVPPPEFRKIEGQSDVSFYEAPGERGNDDQQLLSSAASSAVDSAFNTLAQTVLVKNARTLEDLVREMLRPMLKNWLDDNLPSLVERLVRAEIERVARGH